MKCAASKPSSRASIERISRDILRIPTLVKRNRDHLDFHEVAVWDVRDALKEAYLAGRAAGLKDLADPGKDLVGTLDGTICADEPSFKRFRAALRKAGVP